MTRRSIKDGRRNPKPALRAPGYAAGVGTGALLVLCLAPLAAAPTARADGLELILEPIINSLAAFDPTLGVDFSALATSIDPSFALENAATAATTADSPLDQAALFNQDVYAPIETAEQAWINSATGEQFDSALNTIFGETLIGNGAPGTEADPTGGAGGLLFGDGGAGWNSTEAGVAGGNGGAAGLFGDGGLGGAGGGGAAGGEGGAGGSIMGIGGDGGNGGDGATDAAGGAGGAGGASDGSVFGVGGAGGNGGAGGADALGGSGGDGGASSWLLGDGGNGGDGGDVGTGATGLAALGGAGGQGGVDGTHGMAGDYGAGTLAATQTGTLSQISANGDYLTTSDGQVIELHGVNVVDKTAPYEPASIGFSDQDAAFLEENGINVVRLGVLWAGAEPEPGVYDTSYLDSIQSTVQTLANHGIYTILDFHQDGFSAVTGGDGAPAWATETGGLPNPQLGFPLTEFLNPAESHAWGQFWTNADASNGIGLEDNYAQMVEHVASYFSGNSNVAGIEIMNEPYNQGTLNGLLGGNSAFNSDELTPFYEQTASAIRAVDPNTPILYEPNADYNFDPSTTGLGSLDQPGTVFAIHDYCEVALGTSGCFPDVATAANDAQAYAHANGIPVLMTEFGASSDQTTIGASMVAADTNNMGWTEWAFTGQGDISTTASSPNAEALVYNPELPPTGDNVNTATLQTLAQPYPQEISGTPGSYSFDNGIFQFSYSTQEVDGLGSFAAGSQTTIAVPSVEFPDGYTVSVTGGEVVSAPDAPELVIASNAGASTISVTVTPAT